MPAGYFGAWFLDRLLKGRSARQIERGFWIFVAWLLGFVALFLIAAPYIGPITTVVAFVALVIGTLAVQAWVSR